MALSHTPGRRAAFTIVELLTTIAIIGVLVAMLLPAIQSAREASRRAACANNLKQIALALLNYESARQILPIGASGEGGFGTSWWVQILPHLEQMAVFSRLDLNGSFNGLMTMHPVNAQVVNGFQCASWKCPSNYMEQMIPVGSIQVMTPSYVGIAGAANYGGFPEPRVNACCAADSNLGQISAGGLLIPNRGIRLVEVTDGLSNSIIVGECSDYNQGANGINYRIDGGNPTGWIAGTTESNTPPFYPTDPAKPKPCYNVTTIRYAPNMRDYNQPGVRNDHGPNNPLVSPHPGGVQIASLDGSVRFLPDSTDIWVFKVLATRDDGNAAVLP